MIHFETGGQPSYAHPFRVMTMIYDDDLCRDKNTVDEKSGVTLWPIRMRVTLSI